MIQLTLFLHLRISPAAEGLLARFIFSSGRAFASATTAGAADPLTRRRTRSREPRCRNLGTVSPQCTGLSCPLSVLTQRLATGMIFYRGSFVGVLSDLRSPGRRRREDLCG